jgi:hypothetical protein
VRRLGGWPHGRLRLVDLVPSINSATAPPPQCRGLWKRPKERHDWAHADFFRLVAHPTCLGCSTQVLGYVYPTCILLGICLLF